MVFDMYSSTSMIASQYDGRPEKVSAPAKFAGFKKNMKFQGVYLVSGGYAPRLEM